MKAKLKIQYSNKPALWLRILKDECVSTFIHYLPSGEVVFSKHEDAENMKCAEYFTLSFKFYR